MSNLPKGQDFQSTLLNLYEGAKAAPSLYIKERRLEESRKLKNMALAVEAQGYVQQAGKLICLIEKDIADSNPADSPEKRGQKGGRGHKAVRPDRTAFKRISEMRRAYSGLSPDDVAKRADDVIKEGGVPTRAGFLSERRLREAEARKEAAKERRSSAASREKLKNFRLYDLDIATLKESLEPDSVDFILTDPPYDKAGIPTYKELSHFAGKVLKPGGALIAMAGHAFLQEILNNLCDCPLIKYHWMLTYFMDRGPTSRQYGRKMFSSSKPLFMFVKGEWQRDWMNDTVKLPPIKEKPHDYHKWGQSVEGFKRILDKGFAHPGDVVCDPFLGGGASGLAALQHGCRFIGADIDSECVKIARGRLIEAAEAGKPSVLPVVPNNILNYI